MSKALPAKKKPSGQSSTDSSSGSSSDSSSTSSSSSGSDSSSSSDSDSSSDSSTKNNSSAEQKKSTAQKAPPAAKTAPQQKTATVQKTQRKSTDNKPAEKKVPKPPSKPKPLESSDDEDKPAAVKTKKKPSVKPKSSATVTPKPAAPPPKVSGGGKVPPKANPAAKIQQSKQKDKEESKKKEVVQNGSDANKKKSIFSPENSSESENNDTKNIKAQAIKNTAPKPRSKAAAKPKPVPKKEKVIKSKEIISSASSASSSSESSSSSDSDSESSTSKAPKKSEPENEKKITRKLTRSANTRKSKHVLGKNVYTDTDSDTESTKRSQSRSPVKRAPVSTKGKTKNKKNDGKSRAVEILITEERKCPLEGCNSQGHLGGRQDKHFTIDACPVYHNLTAADCKENLSDRKKREEGRRKILENNKKSPKSQPGLEQKTYLQRIREARAKFKFDLSEEGKVVVDKTKEPVMDSFVPEYDLKLFRDAQAIASEKIEEELKNQPNTKGTKYIEMGKFEMEVWYQSPYPEEFARLPKLYICEYCLRYMRGRTVLERHAAKCVWRHPPGEEVYRKDKISVWEVDGKRYKQYCQNLCLLAKFFLDHKTLYYDVEPFLFYVMTMLDIEGCHTVGYFSKEKNSFLNYNVSCILTLPPYQRQGYGRLLIDFSYLLTRVEGKIGSPEKPLSDLGLISYRSYWKDVLLGYLCSRAGTQLSVKDISQEMAIHSTDIVSTLQALGMMKYWKGKHIILKKQDVLDEYVDRVKRRGSLLKEVDPDCLRWTPFVPPQPNPS